MPWATTLLSKHTESVSTAPKTVSYKSFPQLRNRIWENEYKKYQKSIPNSHYLHSRSLHSMNMIFRKINVHFFEAVKVKMLRKCFSHSECTKTFLEMKKVYQVTNRKWNLINKWFKEFKFPHSATVLICSVQPLHRLQ